MIKDNRSTLFLQADEIDHLTIRYTDFGENLNKEKAVYFICFYSSAYTEVKDALKKHSIFKEDLIKLSEEELYNILVIIRNILLENAF